jgi:nucleotide-binding universal stress UspA family protein
VAAASDADLIVMGSHGRTALEGLLFGSVTNAVLARCTTPVLLLRGAAGPKRSSLSVGIAVDGSAYGKAAVRYALKHRRLFGAAPRFVLIHVVPDLAAIVIPGFGDAPAPLYPLSKIAAAQSTAFERATAPAQEMFARAGVAVETVCRVSNAPGDEIAAFATRRRLDLMVMGSHGYGALKSLALGSVATRTAARCTTPLLLVRAK